MNRLYRICRRIKNGLFFGTDQEQNRIKGFEVFACKRNLSQQVSFRKKKLIYNSMFQCYYYSQMKPTIYLLDQKR